MQCSNSLSSNNGTLTGTVELHKLYFRPLRDALTRSKREVPIK
ncbi:hypothetical protein GQ607_004034, partial [Colletotrichum asianum]